MMQEDQSDPKTEFEKAKLALDISTQHMIRRVINRSSLAPGARRPVGSPPSYRIPAETANSGTEQACTQGSYSFDATSAKLVKVSSQSSGCVAQKELEAEIYQVAIEIWDRIAVQLHENAFRAYVDAYNRYMGHTPEVLGAIATEALSQAAAAQMVGDDALSEKYQKYAHSLVVERCEAAHRDYLSNKSHGTMMQLIITAIEAQFVGADSDPIVQRNGEIIDSLIMEAATTVP